MGKIGEYISKQCGNPHGIIGRIMVRSMNRVNKAMYEGIVNEIEVRENLRILDVGFGNGYLEKLIMKKGKCFIDGIDISEDMVNKAISNNAEYVKAGNMVFKCGDCCSMDYEDEAFDIVATMNTIYFWESTEKGMSEIYRVLKPGGVFYNAVITKKDLDKVFYTKSGFKKFEDEDYEELGKKVGFSSVEIKPLANGISLLVIYSK